MTRVLVDSAVLLDFVLFYQERHRRNRSVASSAAAAVEALLFYDQILVEASSTFGLIETESCQRYLQFYCDDVRRASNQLQDVLQFCEPLYISPDQEIETYGRCLDLLDQNLAPIADPDDLRAYELYDFLPYHLGEDPTAIECRINAMSASDLNELVDNCSDAIGTVLEKFESILHERQHPLRAAWALPLLRFLYYEYLQQNYGLHFLPHATKSTIGFGRESQTIRSKRFIDYCNIRTQHEFAQRVQSVLGGNAVKFPIPGLASTILSRAAGWKQAIELITRLRQSTSIIEFRKVLSSFLEVGQNKTVNESSLGHLNGLVSGINRTTGSSNGGRQVTMSVPFFKATLNEAAEQNSEAVESTFVLIHQLFKDGSFETGRFKADG